MSSHELISYRPGSFLEKIKTKIKKTASRLGENWNRPYFDFINNDISETGEIEPVDIIKRVEKQILDIASDVAGKTRLSSFIHVIVRDPKTDEKFFTTARVTYHPNNNLYSIEQNPFRHISYISTSDVTSKISERHPEYPLICDNSIAEELDVNRWWHKHNDSSGLCYGTYQATHGAIEVYYTLKEKSSKTRKPEKR